MGNDIIHYPKGNIILFKNNLCIFVMGFTLVYYTLLLSIAH